MYYGSSHPSLFLSITSGTRAEPGWCGNAQIFLLLLNRNT